MKGRFYLTVLLMLQMGHTKLKLVSLVVNCMQYFIFYDQLTINHSPLVEIYCLMHQCGSHVNTTDNVLLCLQCFSVIY